MTTVLNDLKTVMDAEQQQLSVGQINGSQLQRITEEKSSLLATLDYLEQQRRLEQNAQRSANDDIAERLAGDYRKNAASSRPQPAQRLAAGRANRA
ncbi:flagella synthesis chaperone protein FlgN [Salmonella enterica subsp. enterica serovar Dublin]|nr:flagella synthesis chaperone protein FlgN [Salmonella enterica subsp. enterica serovar Dublin]